MIEYLNDIDTRFFWWVNGHHCTAADWIMWTASQHWFWAIVLVLYFCLVVLRKEPRKWWVALVGVVLCFLMADQGAVHLFKETVCRLRPCQALEGVRMFRTGCGSKYGFVSNHSANAFAILVFLWLRFGKKSKWDIILMLLWAVLTSYSRAYLGKHYPGDLICGGLFGVCCGLIAWWLTGMAEKFLKKIGTK